MNIFHAFVKVLQTQALQANLRVCLFIYIFGGFTQFTLLVYKSLIMVVENLQKYNWIQHKNAQPVVIVTKRKKLL